MFFEFFFGEFCKKKVTKKQYYDSIFKTQKHLKNISTVIISGDNEKPTQKLAATLAITPEDSFLVHAGARYIRFKWKDLVNYVGSRAKRGLMLPQGFRNVDRVELEKD